MYDWPERRDEVDAEWASIRDRLRASGIDAPETLTRTMDEAEIWRHPDLFFAQTCWGPMDAGLAQHVTVIGQPSYDGVEGGAGEYYSSALIMRANGAGGDSLPAPASGEAVLPLDLMRGKRFAFNGANSMSGIVGLSRDLASLGQDLAIFSEQFVSGGHRLSVRMVAGGSADIAAIDCRSWQLAQLYDPQARALLQVVGWTTRRKGLPFITAKATAPAVVEALRAVLKGYADFLPDFRTGATLARKPPVGIVSRSK